MLQALIEAGIVIGGATLFTAVSVSWIGYIVWKDWSKPLTLFVALGPFVLMLWVLIAVGIHDGYM